MDFGKAKSTGHLILAHKGQGQACFTTLFCNNVWGENSLKGICRSLYISEHKGLGFCALTFPQHNPLIGRELGLNWLGWQVISALSQIPLGTSQPPESPEVRSVTPWRFREGVLHTGQLFSSEQGRVGLRSVLRISVKTAIRKKILV